MDALGDQRFDRVLDPVLPATVCEAGRYLPGQTKAAIGLIKLLKDVLTVADFFFVDQLPPYNPAELIPQKGDAAMALKALKKAHEVLANLPAADFKHDTLDANLRAAAQELKLKAGQMFQPIRVAVCGRKNAPPLFETLEVLGKEKTLARIEQAIGKVQ